MNGNKEPEKEEPKNFVCIWTEKENGKGDVYIPACLGKSSNGVNVFKYCKKHKITLISIFRSCPFCGHNVVVNALKLKGDKDGRTDGKTEE